MLLPRSPMISQHCFRQRTITWANVDTDLCRHIASLGRIELPHWGRVTHICVGILTIIGSDNGLSPGRRQAIIWTNAGILLILRNKLRNLGTNFSEILGDIHSFSLSKMCLKVSSAKWRPCCLGLNVLILTGCGCHCPACRTYLIATRFWVVVICPIIKCLTVLEFSFILFDLCLFITIFNCILNYVPIVTFWICAYHKIWILLIIFCFIWNYWVIYF